MAPAAVVACNVPVYRYALNHWGPAAYRATVFHHGPLSDKDRQRLDALEAAADSSLINLKIRTQDRDAVKSAADRALLEACPVADAPCLVLQYPPSLRLDVPVWSGRFDDGHLTNLCDSPVRTESLRRLATGQTAVWLFLESSDQSLNETALSTLTESLKS
ncbi:MAG TPA: hypothetical protein VM510_06565, partial [Caulifigura sp.]|nr:hypothetical protein [Caulifigura sp.]